MKIPEVEKWLKETAKIIEDQVNNDIKEANRAIHNLTRKH